MFRFTELALLVASAAAHTVITYPGWRGDNILTNGTVSPTDPSIPPGSLGTNWHNDTQSYGFPYGMQWQYPCGGMPMSRNRTNWPIGGGAVAVQPGWFPGHSLALIYVNLGIGNEPLNYSHIMNPVFQLAGPSNVQYDGTFCLPQVPLPTGYTPAVGDNATIQVIETAQHGAALYNCVDITFTEPEDVAEVTKDNCFNSSNFGFNLVFTSTSLSAAHPATQLNIYASILVPLALVFASWLS